MDSGSSGHISSARYTNEPCIPSVHHLRDGPVASYRSENIASRNHSMHAVFRIRPSPCQATARVSGNADKFRFSHQTYGARTLTFSGFAILAACVPVVGATGGMVLVAGCWTDCWLHADCRCIRYLHLFLFFRHKTFKMGQSMLRSPPSRCPPASSVAAIRSAAAAAPVSDPTFALIPVQKAQQVAPSAVYTERSLRCRAV
jgi:hypothetical protein